jgi:hypothetical protein
MADSFNPMLDSREAFSAQDEVDFEAREEMAREFDAMDDREFEDDGQPSEYEEWQDYMGGDDWDHGQYDAYDGE